MFREGWKSHTNYASNNILLNPLIVLLCLSTGFLFCCFFIILTTI